MSTIAKSVSLMKSGETAIIAGFTDEHLSIKLLEMGFLPGTVIRFNYRAPFGDPICVNISGFDISLRLDEASTIIILD